MVTRESATKAELASEVWRRMFDFLMSTHEHRNRALERLGLTPGDSKALIHLEAGIGQSMGSLAAAWTCDASNATWVVDRLEQRGLVERRGMPGDRRVKEVVLTPLGVEMKGALLDALYEPPPELHALPRADLEMLLKGARKLPALDASGHHGE